jgi:hypothetical protein
MEDWNAVKLITSGRLTYSVYSGPSNIRPSLTRFASYVGRRARGETGVGPKNRGRFGDRDYSVPRQVGIL